MDVSGSKPLIVQSDRSMLMETDHPLYEQARDEISAFAEIVSSPEHYHTYRLTPLSLWNAASSGLSGPDILESLNRFSRYPLPQNIEYDIIEYISRFGRVKLLAHEDGILLECDDSHLLDLFWHDKQVRPLLEKKLNCNRASVRPRMRGMLKQALIRKEYPVEDLAGYTTGEPLAIGLRETTGTGIDFNLRKYQRDAVQVYHQDGRLTGGSGVLVLPCGAGKTIIAIGCMSAVGQHCLVIVTNITALRQWRDELLDKTLLTSDMIGEYSGELKEIRPVTITTYQILTYRKRRDEDFLHMNLFNRDSWGLIIYDEVHMLPAPVFRAVADIQAKRRLGLTATLLREDGRETDVFSLIGPKKIDIPWKTLEKQGWIAQALCIEIRVPLQESLRHAYAVADSKTKFRIASENESKIGTTRRILEQHAGERILIIGHYLDQLDFFHEELDAPIITGKTPNKEREMLYSDFKAGRICVLVVSKVANFAVDLPDASVAIQISGTFGSRQEEAQRLGRILRPKSNHNTASFYTLVTRDTRECEFAVKRQLFLTEQGYRYRIVNSFEELEPESILSPVPGMQATAP
jgi:DNA excision repair protein ERCC-3